jgi:hypothetical protein
VAGDPSALIRKQPETQAEPRLGIGACGKRLGKPGGLGLQLGAHHFSGRGGRYQAVFPLPGLQHQGGEGGQIAGAAAKPRGRVTVRNDLREHRSGAISQDRREAAAAVNKHPRKIGTTEATPRRTTRSIW